MMPLVEIVKTELSTKKTIQQAIAFTLHIGKLPLPVKSSPGFLVNRILMPYLVEAITLFEEGVSPEAIDKAALDFGMPMGPVELADTVGIDICYSVAKNLAEAFGSKVPEGLEQYIHKNNLGKKTGRGFYRYKKGKPIKNRDADLGDQKMIQNRLVFRLLNEAAACIDEKIVDNKDLLDAGIIFGTGFAPFRGGPMNYSLQTSVDDITQTMKEYGTQYGDRFNPVKGWSKIKQIQKK
jgi:3-hydroxyacyl-CoA dehydrogenase/enoyl-CoA hydratase/3-hydroxybutyryl-CoA epimerase